MLDPEERGEIIAHISKFSDINISPGPGSYNTNTTLLDDVPIIKMKSRHSLHTESNNAPYYYSKSNFGQTSPIRMRSRHLPQQSWTTPGPSYIPPPFGSQSPGYSFGSPSKKFSIEKDKQSQTHHKRNHSKKFNSGPGPGDYNLRGDDFAGNGKHGIKISGSRDFAFQNNHTPGPAAYKPRSDAILPSSPKYTIQHKLSSKRDEVTPGYRNLGSTLGEPRFSIKTRVDDQIVIIQ